MPGLAEAFERIGTALEHHLPVTHAAGVALAVTDADDTLGVAVRGFADAASGAPVRAETRFQIGSISKSFAAIVAMQEVEAGRLDLHVSVNELLPWLELPEPFGPITLHHLLSHTGGLMAGTEESPTALGALEILRRMPPTFPPGERFWYSNDGYKVVGAVLERITGTPIHDLLRERLLAPLGMTASTAAISDDVRVDLATAYTPMPSDRPPQLRHPLVPATWIVSNSADGSIVSNAVDLCAYARLLLRGGDLPGPDGARILSASAFDRLTTSVIDDGEGGRYAYGLWHEEVDGHRWIAHSGGMVGFTAFLATSPDEQLACVALQNGDGGKHGVAAYALAAVRACLAGEPLPEPWAPPEPTSIPGADAYAGRYEGDDGSALQVDVEADGLRVVLGEASTRLERDPLSPPSDRFLLSHPGLERFPLTFGRGADGRVVEAFHGDTWFRGEGYEGSEPAAAPEAWRAFPGLYRSNDPWIPTLRVVLRKGRLALQWPVEAGDEAGEAELAALEDGWFACGEPWVPRRIRFDRVVDGKAVVAAFNGGRWYRSFED